MIYANIFYKIRSFLHIYTPSVHNRHNIYGILAIKYNKKPCTHITCNCLYSTSHAVTDSCLVTPRNRYGLLLI